MPDIEYVIAKEPLFVDGVRAHNAGDRVPADNVKAIGWEKQTAKPGTQAAEAAQQS